MSNNYQNISRGSVRLFLAVLCLAATIVPNGVNAQVVLQREGFEGTIFPPPGWAQAKDPAATVAAFSRQAGAGTNPIATPPVGSNMMKFNSFNAANGEIAYLYSKPFDFSNSGATAPTFSFQMFRDNFNTNPGDKIEVYYNTIPSMTGATGVNHLGGVNVIPRYSGAFPTGTANAFNTYLFTMPIVAYPKKIYIILKATSGFGNNIFIDDFQVNTFPSPMVTGDVEFDLVQQNLASVGQNTTNQWIVGVRCVVSGSSGCGRIGFGSVKLDSLMFNTNGTSSLADIQNCKVWYTGGSNQFSTGYVSPFPIGGPGEVYTTNTTVVGTGQYKTTIPPATNLDFTGTSNCFVLEYDTTYFWLTYDIKSTAVGGNLVDADFRGAAISSGNGCPTPPGGSITVTPTTSVLPGGAQIDLAYCVPTYTVGTAWAGYTNNDYVQSVELLGGVAGSYISTTTNAVAVQSPAASCYPNCNFAGHPPDYELRPNATGSSIIFTQLQTYFIKVQAGTWFSSNYIQVWVDWNHDGDFMDPLEQIQSTPLPNLASNQFVTYTINVPGPSSVPAYTYTGSTRMRVREVFANSSIDPCAQYTFGEVEDFNVTILPNCPVGYCLWLGNTADWQNPANWCGGVPTLLTDAVVDKGNSAVGAATKTYYVPYIKSGIAATTKNLTIAATDSLYIDAPNPASSSLKMRGDFNLNGKSYVNGGFNDSIPISTGAIQNLITPFKGLSSDARCQIIYTASELTTLGFAMNDQITSLGFNFYARGSTQAYPSFTIKYTNGGGIPTAFPSNSPYAATTTVFGPTALDLTVLPNTGGFYKINLASPMVWDGVNNILLEISFDNNASTMGGDDKVYITQTTGRKSTLLLSTGAAAPPASYSGSTLTYAPPNVGDNFFSGNGFNRPNITFFTNRPYGKPVITIQGNWNNNGLTTGSSMGFKAGNSKVVFDSTTYQSIQGTQLTTFHELEINKTNFTDSVKMQKNVIVGDTLWMSKGELVINKQSLIITNSGKGAITRTNGFLMGEDTLSKVKWVVGTPNDNLGRVIPFTAYPASAANYVPFTFTPAATNTGAIDTLIAATYKTNNANLPYPPTVSHLNRGFNTVTLPGTASTAITSGSAIITNLPAFAGIAIGDLITCTTNGKIPYGTTVLAYNNTIAPYSITMSANAIASLAGTNIILWFSPPGVINNDSAATADRYWVISKSNTTGLPATYNVGLSFLFTLAEKPSVSWLAGQTLRPQPWRTYTSSGLQMGGWQRLLLKNDGSSQYTPASPGVILGVGTVPTVTINNYDFQFGSSNAWAITSNSAPLPIELLDFKAEPVGCKVRIAWKTASEKDNDYFTVERSPVSVDDYTFVAKVNSYFHTSSTPLDYEAYDLTPLKGMQWYRLKQTDMNSDYTYSDPVLVTFNCEGTAALPFDILNVFSDQISTGLTQVEFAYNSDQPVNYTIIDATGRLIASGSGIAAQPGVNRITLNQSLTSGMYIISLQNDVKIVSRKFIY